MPRLLHRQRVLCCRDLLLQREQLAGVRLGRPQLGRQRRKLPRAILRYRLLARSLAEQLLSLLRLRRLLCIALAAQSEDFMHHLRCT